MTLDERLYQIYLILIDLATKLDRFIEGNGQIMAEASKIAGIEREVADIKKDVFKIPSIEREVADIKKDVSKIAGIEREVARIPSLERSVSLTAKGLIDLTTTVNQRFDQFDQDLATIKSDQQLILQILREKRWT